MTMDTAKGILSVGMGIFQAPTELQCELDNLDTKLQSARSLISRSEWGMSKSMELDALLVKLKYATYDAEDLLREHEDRVLRQKLEDADRSRVGQVLSSSLNVIKHVILDSSKRVKDTQDKLGKVMAEVKEVLSSTGLGRVEHEPVQFMPTTTEIITASQVYGRDTERDQLTEMLGVTATIDREDDIDQVVTQMITHSGSKGKSTAGLGIDASTSKSAKRHKGDSSSSSALLAEATNFADNVSVLPIFGIGGMGKTTLAQLIYNDKRVTTHFTVRIWVCVSDLFDIDRMTREIVKTICPNFDLSCPLGVLQVQLMELLKSQMFVLVLDDIWQITEYQWDSFCAPLRNGLEGSMILVTTRHENIARLVTTSNCKPAQLKGLPDDVFWEFFKKCAFGKDSPESYPHLQVIGRSISSKLCGTPLAAKTLGHLLNSNLTEQHWMTIKDSELWDQEQKEGDILPALRLSYLYLPTELRRCFAFCSIFPKDYSFGRDEIVDIWVAEGFVASLQSMCIEDVRIRCFDELRDRCLFQADPKFPNQDRYVMHDLIHDTAQYVSMHEYFSMQDLSKMTHKFRHISVEVDGRSLNTVTSIAHLNKLRSIRFGAELSVEISWFSQLSNILFLSLRGCKLENLPQSICELNSLRYLDISHSAIKELPAKFWCLYNLQVVDASNSNEVKEIPQDVTRLINLRRLQLTKKASESLSKVRGLGSLSSLQNLRYFTIAKRKGSIGELKGMNELRGKLEIRSIYTVRSKEDACEARLIDKKYLDELYLNWRISPDRHTFEPRPSENEVMDGLCPNERIKSLEVHAFWGDRLPSWFNPKDLQNLRSLKLFKCPYIETFSVPYLTGGTQGGSLSQHASSSTNCNYGISSLAFTHLTSIRIAECRELTNLDNFLSPKNLPWIESISLSACHMLESIPADSFVGFVHLRDLKITRCNKLVCPQSGEMVLPLSLRRLFISRCGQLDRSFPSCLEKLTSLSVLDLTECDNVESIPFDLIPCRNSLIFLRLEHCPKLSSIGGSAVPSSINYVEVSRCAKLTQVSQPFIKNVPCNPENNAILKFLNS